jgi:peptidoglycan/xylan/chitin deacetylase (PgdA/CDA1 family)
MFHRVHSQPDPLFPREMDAAGFRTRLAWLRDLFALMPLDEAVAALARGALPARAAAITFDDGYADNVEVALPILREMHVPATFFIATGFLEGGAMWNDRLIEAIRAAPGPILDVEALGLGLHPIASAPSRRAAIDAILPRLKHLPPDEREAQVNRVVAGCGGREPPSPMMRAEGVRRLAAAGMGIGAHTVTHPILAVVDDATARQEIRASRETLEAIVRQPVRLFAYPNGKPGTDYRRRDVDLVRSLGFDAAFSTAWGAARREDERFELPRFTPWDRTPARWALRLVRNLAQPIERAAA